MYCELYDENDNVIEVWNDEYDAIEELASRILKSKFEIVNSNRYKIYLYSHDRVDIIDDVAEWIKESCNTKHPISNYYMLGWQV